MSIKEILSFIHLTVLIYNYTRIIALVKFLKKRRKILGKGKLVVNLKPCPFCGCEKIKGVEVMARKYYAVYCCGCGCSTKESFKSLESAAEAWNTRIPEEEKINGTQYYDGRGVRAISQF